MLEVPVFALPEIARVRCCSVGRGSSGDARNDDMLISCGRDATGLSANPESARADKNKTEYVMSAHFAHFRVFRFIPNRLLPHVRGAGIPPKPADASLRELYLDVERDTCTKLHIKSVPRESIGTMREISSATASSDCDRPFG